MCKLNVYFNLKKHVYVIHFSQLSVVKSVCEKQEKFKEKKKMGCKLGKLAASTGGGTGSSKHDEPPPPAPTDPRLPLTAKQKYSMLASWKGISRAMESTGVYMFLRYVKH